MDNHYVTKDLYIASFLLINNFVLVNTIPDNRIIFFHFKNSTKLEKLLLKYYSRSTTVEPTRFLDEIKHLRHRVRDILRQ